MNIDKQVLFYAGGVGSGGYVRYCRGLLSNCHLADSLKIFLVISPSFHRKLGQISGSVQVFSHPWIESPSIIKRFIWHFVLYPRLLLRVKPEVEFYASGFLPPLRRLRKGCATIVTTCHNLLPFYLKNDPKLKSYSEYVAISKLMRNHYDSLQSSNAIIFLSEESKKIVSKFFSTLQRNTVVAHGIDPFYLATEVRNYELGDVIRVLYVSPIYPYKHQVEVVTAIARLRAESNLDIRLRLVGGGSPQAVKKLRDYVDINGAKSFVSIIEFVDDVELSHEYKQTDIFLFASSCESFGITLVEAMGQRLPIACSRETGLPEVLRDAGVYFDPTDPFSIAHALNELLVDQPKRKMFGEKAYNYSLDFTWEKCAKNTFDFLGEK